MIYLNNPNTITSNFLIMIISLICTSITVNIIIVMSNFYIDNDLPIKKIRTSNYNLIITVPLI
jgi:hypothetical protein